MLLLAAASLLDHLGLFGYRGDDQALYQRRSVLVCRLTDDDALMVQRPDGAQTPLRLIGLRLPLSRAARADLNENVVGRCVILNVTEPQTRDERGRLLAYAYLADSDDVALDLIRRGLARADRRTLHPLHVLFAMAESDARRHHRGAWAPATATAP